MSVSYAPQAVTATWFPVGYKPLNFTGRVDGGDFLDAAYDDPERVKTVSAFGITTHVGATNDTGTLTLNLQGSDGDAKLMRQIMAASEAAVRTGGLVITGPLVVRDNQATKEIMSIEDAAASSAPNMTFGEARPDRSYTFKGRIRMTTTSLT